MTFFNILAIEECPSIPKKQRRLSSPADVYDLASSSQG